MPLTLVYIDHRIFADKALTDYFERSLKAFGRTAEKVCYIESNDPSMPARLQEIVSEKGELCIAASGESFPLVGRILSTLKNDELIAYALRDVLGCTRKLVVQSNL